MAAIEVTGLRKAYGGMAAVDGIDLTVEAGEVVALLGPNGAGKTTAVEILEGYRARMRRCVRPRPTTRTRLGVTSESASASSCRRPASRRPSPP